MIIVGSTRELLGTGALLGYTLLLPVSQGGWFEPMGLMQLAPAGFFIIALLIWAIRSIRTEQVDASEFTLSPTQVRR